MQTPPLPGSNRPRIGIPVRLSSSTDPDPRVAEANQLFDYIVELVRDGGGEPVLLASPDEALEALDGVVLPGGGDLDPRLYGEEPGDACYDVSHAQDELDLAVARRSIDAGLPLLGICRGHQLLNVLYGGTLIQDMDPGAVAHREPAPAHGAGPWAWHEVDVHGGSKVAGLYGGVGERRIRERRHGEHRPDGRHRRRHGQDCLRSPSGRGAGRRRACGDSCGRGRDRRGTGGSGALGGVRAVASRGPGTPGRGTARPVPRLC